MANGSAAQKTNDFGAYSKKLYGDKILSDTPGGKDGIKCFALCACRDELNQSVEPFLLRTYTHPLDGKKKKRWHYHQEQDEKGLSDKENTCDKDEKNNNEK